ncbi:MAG TPA: anion permease [Candidatus Azoamicus sp. OHIO2]
MNEPAKLKGAKLYPSLVLLSLFIIFWFIIPTPNGVSSEGWHLFIIFILTILGLIINPLPMGAIAFTAMAVVIITKTLSLKMALSSFSSNIVWLIIAAFLLARGFIKTGLGSRIAYYFVSILGKSTLGLAYGLTVAELLFAPLMPSNTARGAGIIYPIIAALNEQYKSKPELDTRKKIGSYLIKLLYQINVLTSAMFLTATAGNPLIVSIAMGQHIEITWGTWAIACIVPGVVSLIVLPVLLYVIYPPEMKDTPEAPTFAKEKLHLLGPLSTSEIVMLFVFAFLLVLWVFGDKYGIDATSAAIIGLSILLISGVLKWDDITTESRAWDTFIWMAVLIMLSDQLSKMGITGFFGDKLQKSVANFNWITVFILVSLFYFYVHYFFASMTAHISAMYGTLLVVAINSGVPPMLIALFLGVGSSLSAGLTHYGTGTAPVYFGTNYVTTSEWWTVGLIVSVTNLLIWGIIGTFWWKILGYW